jgi:hypothetical protein
MTNANARPEPQLRSCYDHIYFSGMGSARSCRGAGGIGTDFCLRRDPPNPHNSTRSHVHRPTFSAAVRNSWRGLLLLNSPADREDFPGCCPPGTVWLDFKKDEMPPMNPFAMTHPE